MSILVITFSYIFYIFTNTIHLILLCFTNNIYLSNYYHNYIYIHRISFFQNAFFFSLSLYHNHFSSIFSLLLFYASSFFYVFYVKQPKPTQEKIYLSKKLITRMQYRHLISQRVCLFYFLVSDYVFSFLNVPFKNLFIKFKISNKIKVLNTNCKTQF